MRGRSLLFVAAMLASAGLGGASVSADEAPAVTVTVGAVTILTPAQDAISSPVAQVPGEGQVSLRDWRSTADQPVAKLHEGSLTASSTQSMTAGSVALTRLRVFDGELRVRSLDLTVSRTPGAPVIELSGKKLDIAGADIALPAVGAGPVPLGDWGQITTGVTLTDDSGTKVIGLRLEILADHGGLPTGSEIRVGVVSFPPDGGGGTGTPPPSPPPTPPPNPPGHHHHQSHKGAHHGGGTSHGTQHHPPVQVTHPSHLPRLRNGVRARVVRAAEDQIGWPYIWGGESRSEGGFDCSGLVNYAYSAAGHRLPGRPTAAVLWQMGIPIALSQLRPGDLAFLGAPSGAPYHVGLYAGRGIVVVASGRGEPIAAVRLASVAWDGFARIWAAGSVTPLRAQWLTAATDSHTRPTQSDRRADLVAAGRAIQTRYVTMAKATAQIVKSARLEKRAPSPRKPRHPSPTAINIADVRVRVATSPLAGPLPSA
jgi:cell wall-associated NlpC family hydrolase